MLLDMLDAIHNAPEGAFIGLLIVLWAKHFWIYPLFLSLMFYAIADIPMVIATFLFPCILVWLFGWSYWFSYFISAVPCLIQAPLWDHGIASRAWLYSMAMDAASGIQLNPVKAFMYHEARKQDAIVTEQKAAHKQREMDNFEEIRNRYGL